jgi:hypothetical protein
MATDPEHTSLAVTYPVAKKVRQLAADLTSENGGKRVQIDEVISRAVKAFRELHVLSVSTDQEGTD